MKLRKKLLAAGLAGAIAAAGLGLSLASAGGGEPGSSSDPLVTQSYVQKLIQEKFEEITGNIQPGGGGSLEWQVKTLQPGETFAGSAGTEFILRGGAAVIVDPTGSGIPDITSGTNYAAGKQVPANHLFIIPRSDGRGIKAVKQAVVMYRG